MTLSQTTTGVIALSALGTALVSLFLAFGMGRRLRALRRSVSARRGGSIAHTLDSAQEIAEELVFLRESVAHSVQQVGLIRFDAFDDMGGKLSFSAALLDGDGSGIVLSAINGRSETRIYAKPVEHGTSRHNLSGEEEEAIRRALSAVPR